MNRWPPIVAVAIHFTIFNPLSNLFGCHQRNGTTANCAVAVVDLYPILPIRVSKCVRFSHPQTISWFAVGTAQPHIFSLPGQLHMRADILRVSQAEHSRSPHSQRLGLYAPARYIDKIEVKTGDKVVFTVEGGISFSEDPSIRFTYDGNPSDPMAVTAQDSDGTQFAGRSTPSAS